jgi:hypothetical protein
MLHKNSADKFSFEDCKFTVQRSKESTGKKEEGQIAKERGKERGWEGKREGGKERGRERDRKGKREGGKERALAVIAINVIKAGI